MQLTLAVVVLCACVAITVQQGGPMGPTGPTGPTGPSGPGGPAAPTASYNEDDDEWSEWYARRQESMSDDEDDEDDEDDDDEKDSMDKPSGPMDKPRGPMQKMGGDSMKKMDDSKSAPPPTGIHMKFEFDMGAAAMAGMAGQGQKDGNSGSKDGKSGNMMGGKSGNMMGGKSGSMMGGKSGSMMGGKSGSMMGGKSGSMMGGKSSKAMGDNKDKDIKKHATRPHRPILCRVNASGTIVKRDCPFHMVCGGAKGIRQGGWTMYFCRYDHSKMQLSEFDYPDEREVFGKSDDQKDEDTSSDSMDDKDVVDG